MKLHAFNQIICRALLGLWTCIWPKQTATTIAHIIVIIINLFV